jgi:hypothetical protein
MATKKSVGTIREADLKGKKASQPSPFQQFVGLALGSGAQVRASPSFPSISNPINEIRDDVLIILLPYAVGVVCPLLLE